MQRGEHGELTIGLSVPFSLVGETLNQFRAKHDGVSIEIVESTSRAGLALVQQRRVDVAFVVNPRLQDATRSLHLRDEPMIAVLPKAHRLAHARELALDELHTERLILSAWGIGPDIEEELLKGTARRGLKSQVQLHRAGQCNLVNMVGMGFGVTITAGSPFKTTIGSVVLVPLAASVISMHAVWVESNRNPALKALIAVLRKTVGVPGSSGD